MRQLDEFEVGLLKQSAEHPSGAPVGGVLDETREMLCNSYGLLVQTYPSDPRYPLGAWSITEAGKRAIETGYACASCAAAQERIERLEAAINTAQEGINSALGRLENPDSAEGNGDPIADLSELRAWLLGNIGK